MKYIVRTGDDLNSISSRFGADPSMVASMNFIDGDLRIGDVLEVPSGITPDMSIQQEAVPGYAEGKTVKRKKKRPYALRPGAGQDIQAELMKASGLPPAAYDYPAETGMRAFPGDYTQESFSPEIWEELEARRKQRWNKAEKLRRQYEQSVRQGIYDPPSSAERGIQEYAMGGIVQPDPTGVSGLPTSQQKKKIPPPIFGQSMPDTGISRAVMGDIQDPKPDISPKQHAQEMQSRKRLSKMSQGGGRPQRPQRPQRPGGQEGMGGGGIQMLDELWSTLAPQQRNFALGGEVDGGPGGDVGPSDASEYEQVYQETLDALRSGVGDIEQNQPTPPPGLGGAGPMGPQPPGGMGSMPPLPGGPVPLSPTIAAMGPRPQGGPPGMPGMGKPMPGKPGIPMPPKPSSPPVPVESPATEALELVEQQQKSVDAIEAGIMAARSLKSGRPSFGIGDLI